SCLVSLPLAPRSTLFPYTTLFRSWAERLSTMMWIARRRACVSTTDCRKATNSSLVCRGTALPTISPVWVLSAASRRRVSPHDLRSEEHTSELQSPDHLVCRLLLEN